MSKSEEHSELETTIVSGTFCANLPVARRARGARGAPGACIAADGRRPARCTAVPHLY